jgi:hypothetical protein
MNNNMQHFEDRFHLHRNHLLELDSGWKAVRKIQDYLQADEKN